MEADMDNLTQTQVRAEMEKMQQQVNHWTEQARYANEQLVMSRGAQQAFEHLLSLFNPAQDESEGDDGITGS